MFVKKKIMECSLIPDGMNICGLDEENLWNASALHVQQSSAGSTPIPSAQLFQEPTRSSRIYNLFRRATVAHGFGSEYQSELRNLLGEKWTDSWAIWALAIPATLFLGLMAHLVMKSIFGRLRMSERQHTRERLWNFAFYKFIFIFGVVNVESVEEMIIWVDWFIILGYIHFLIVLSRDRCEYMTFSPVPANKAHHRIVILLGTIIGCSFGILAVSAYFLWAGFFHTGLFVAAEGALVLLPTWHILLRYGFHHLRQGRSTAKWEKRTSLYYYLNFFCESGNLFADLFHHVHMMCEVCNLSASSLVIVAQIRFLGVELINKYRRHRNYTAIQKRLQASFPSASAEEIERHGGPCSICWDTLEQARKLHCGHIFHETCLLSWLEQDISCPICRVGLNDTFSLGNTRRNGHVNGEEGERYFTFEGSRLNRWLPNVSVTVSHHPFYEYVDSGSIESMAEQVRQVFPNVSHHAIIQDLLETGSAEVTIDNILSGVFSFTQPVIPQSRPLTVTSGNEINPALTSDSSSTNGAKDVLDSPEACRAMQIQRKETILYEARKNFLTRLAKEKVQSAKSSPIASPTRRCPTEQPQLTPGRR